MAPPDELWADDIDIDNDHFDLGPSALFASADHSTHHHNPGSCPACDFMWESISGTRRRLGRRSERLMDRSFHDNGWNREDRSVITAPRVTRSYLRFSPY